MYDLFQYLLLLIVLIVFYQLYTYAVHLEGEVRQRTCQRLGIFCTTLGIAGFVLRTIPVVIGAVILFMLGLRLIAYGLDRLDKKIFIDRFDEDQ